MYCRKCGKQIDYDAVICKECEEAEILQAQSTQPVGSRKEGFSGALTSTILSSIAFVLSIVAMAFVTVAIEAYAYGASFDIIGFVVISIVLSLISLGLAIPGLILGIKGMKCFFRAKNEGRIKPIPTLVCGIVGMVMSSLTMLYIMITFIMCALI